MAKKKTAYRTFDDLVAPHTQMLKDIARRLRELVFKTLEDVDENIVGGAKVGLALYSRGEPGKVLCGIQLSSDSCLLYVHHLKEVEHDRIKLEGRGKHARHVRFRTLEDARRDDVEWLLRQVEERASVSG